MNVFLETAHSAMRVASHPAPIWPGAGRHGPRRPGFESTHPSNRQTPSDPFCRPRHSVPQNQDQQLNQAGTHLSYYEDVPEARVPQGASAPSAPALPSLSAWHWSQISQPQDRANSPRTVRMILKSPPRVRILSTSRPFSTDPENAQPLDRTCRSGACNAVQSAT